MSKIKRSLTVMDLRDSVFYGGSGEFKVIKAVNITSYAINQHLSKGEVDNIIHSGTQVTVVPYKR